MPQKSVSEILDIFNYREKATFSIPVWTRGYGQTDKGSDNFYTVLVKPGAKVVQLLSMVATIHLMRDEKTHPAVCTICQEGKDDFICRYDQVLEEGMCLEIRPATEADTEVPVSRPFKNSSGSEASRYIVEILEGLDPVPEKQLMLNPNPGSTKTGDKVKKENDQKSFEIIDAPAGLATLLEAILKGSMSESSQEQGPDHINPNNN